MQFKYVPVNDWPTLAWLVQLRSGLDTIEVFHGPGVEVKSEWFCEGIWAGPFSHGNFDRTDLVFGSGGRLRDGHITLVAPGSGEDRLQYLVTDAVYYVSNSLACLMACSRAQFDPTYAEYWCDINSIMDGLESYQDRLPTTLGPVRLLYFTDLVWDGRQLQHRRKPGGNLDLPDFSAYADYLKASLSDLIQNLQAAERKNRFRTIGTLSRGYDSTAVSALTAPLGVREVITFSEARGGGNDDGGVIADVLGLELVRLDRDGWRQEKNLPEVPFLASEGLGVDLHFKSAEPWLCNRVLFTGYPGEHWRMNPPSLERNLVRNDCGGLSLTEYRLQIGMVHCAVGYFGARQTAEICAINQSEEMRPWVMPGNYNKPILRRITEAAGVPREVFGQRKMATAVVTAAETEYLTPASMSDFRRWLHEQPGGILRPRHLKSNDWLDRLRLYSMKQIESGSNALIGAIRCLPMVWRLRPDTWLWRQRHLSASMDNTAYGMRAALFPWAQERQMERYRSADALASNAISDSSIKRK